MMSIFSGKTDAHRAGVGVVDQGVDGACMSAVAVSDSDSRVSRLVIVVRKHFHARDGVTGQGTAVLALAAHVGGVRAVEEQPLG